MERLKGFENNSKGIIYRAIAKDKSVGEVKGYYVYNYAEDKHLIYFNEYHAPCIPLSIRRDYQLVCIEVDGETVKELKE